MAYRRKRRSRGTWFPTFGFRAGGETNENDVSGQLFEVDLDGSSGAIITEIKDLTYDYPQEPDDAQPDHTLSDIIGNEYLLQRIVGKCFARYDRGADNDAGFSALCGLGFFIARAEADGNGPLGAGNLTAQDVNKSYSPLTINAIREPWIWRRTWILEDRPPAVAFVEAWPQTNAGYGSIQDGPHIDSKVKRRVSQDDRLYAAFSACVFPPGTRNEEANFGQVTAWLDYQIFGSLRKAKNRSAF